MITEDQWRTMKFDEIYGMYVQLLKRVNNLENMVVKNTLDIKAAKATI
jgi:hypothetical protein